MDFFVGIVDYVVYKDMKSKKEFKGYAQIIILSCKHINTRYRENLYYAI